MSSIDAAANLFEALPTGESWRDRLSRMMTVKVDCDCGHVDQIPLADIEVGRDYPCGNCAKTYSFDATRVEEFQQQLADYLSEIDQREAASGRDAGAASDHFFALDVETANAAYDSICQIGLVEFRDGVEVGCESWLIDPDDDFDDYNIEIHGITPAMVRGKPTFDVAARDLIFRVGGSVLVSHTHFDRTAIGQACARYMLPVPEFRWLDSARVARRTWDHCRNAGYGLKDLAQFLAIEFRHHDALEDARAAGLVLLRAVEHSGTAVADWLNMSRFTAGKRERIRLEGSEDGALSGEMIVFTGQLRAPRAEMAAQANAMGAGVSDGVTKKTTILVVGDQDIKRLAGHEKSSKHRKAEELQAKGKPIQIMRESDWAAMIALFELS